MTREEKEIVTELARHLAEPPPPDADDMEAFWWNYGSEQLSDELPWGDDFERASYLHTVAERYARIIERQENAA